jgi:hypothetical protein
MALVKVDLETTFDIPDEELQGRTANGACQLVDQMITEWLATNPRANIAWLVQDHVTADAVAA